MCAKLQKGFPPPLHFHPHSPHTPRTHPPPALMGVAYAFLSFVYGGKWGEGELSGSGGGWVRTTAVVDKWTAVDVRIFLSDVRVFPFAYRTEKQYKKGRDMNVRVRVMFLFFRLAGKWRDVATEIIDESDGKAK